MSGTLKFSNNASSTLVSGITAAATTCELAPGTGILFPTLAAGQYFVGTFTDQLTRTLREIVYVTGISGDTITAMTRGQEGTTAAAWNENDIFANQVTAGSLLTYQPAIAGASNFLLGPPATDGGNPVNISVTTGLSLTDDTLSVDFGTGAGEALQGSTLGQPGGPAALDANGYLTGQQVLPTGSLIPVSLGGVASQATTAYSEAATASAGVATNTVAIAGLQNTVTGLQIAQIPQGGWNASTNTPTLTSSVGTAGYAYVVSVAGTTNLNGITTWNVGDTAIFNGTVWVRNPLGGVYAPILAPAFQSSVSVASAVQISAAGGINGFLFVGSSNELLAVIQRDGSILSLGASATIAGVNFGTLPGVNKFLQPAAIGFGSVSGVNAILFTGPSQEVLVSLPFGNTAVASGYTQTQINTLNDIALGISNATKTANNTTAIRPTSAYTLIVGYGQSEEQSDQGSPALTTAALNGHMMLGLCTRPLAQTSSTFGPVGGASVLYPLISVNQNPSNGAVQGIISGGFSNISSGVFTSGSPSTMTLTGATGVQEVYNQTTGVLTSTPMGGTGQPALDLTTVFTAGEEIEIAFATGAAAEMNARFGMNIQTVTATTITLSGGGVGFGYAGTATGFSIYAINNAGSFGEDPCVGFANDWSILQQFSNPTGLNSRFIVINTAVAGQTIAQLSKGATPDLYNRMIDGATQIQALATAGNYTFAVGIMAYAQGGNDVAYQTTQAAYTAALVALVADMRADFAAITGQTKPPLFLFDQISQALLGSDYGNDAVPMAQLEFALSPPNPDVYLTGPTYYRPDSAIHPTSNGYRWKAAMRAKIANRILSQNQGWLPLYPLELYYNANQGIITFHVPVPPLQFRPGYKVCTPTMFADAGFVWTDSVGINPITSVVISASCTLLFTFQRSFSSQPRVQYADATVHSGIGNLFDSDNAISSMSYIYNDFSGQIQIENIPAFTDTSGLTGATYPSPVGQPYPLFNACCVFNLLATELS